MADKLKAGMYVEPELFPEASVYFSDIVSFTTLASESSPMEVITMLNDLYLMFDTILAQFNVYKVHFAYRSVNDTLTSVKFQSVASVLKESWTCP